MYVDVSKWKYSVTGFACYIELITNATGNPFIRVIPAMTYPAINYVTLQFCKFSGNAFLYDGFKDTTFNNTQYKLNNNLFTGIPKAHYEHVTVFNFAANLVNTENLDIWLSWLNVYFDNKTPLSSCTYTLNGVGMGIPTDGAANADLVAIKDHYTAAGKVATFVINT